MKLEKFGITNLYYQSQAGLAEFCYWSNIRCVWHCYWQVWGGKALIPHVLHMFSA